MKKIMFAIALIAMMSGFTATAQSDEPHDAVIYEETFKDPDKVDPSKSSTLATNIILGKNYGASGILGKEIYPLPLAKNMAKELCTNKQSLLYKKIRNVIRAHEIRDGVKHKYSIYILWNPAKNAWIVSVPDLDIENVSESTRQFVLVQRG